MRQKTKKLLSVVLSLSMAFSVMPLTAYAADESGTEVAEQTGPILSTMTEENGMTTSGASFELSSTGAYITLDVPADTTTSSAAFDITTSDGYTGTEEFDAVTVNMGPTLLSSLASLNSYTLNLQVATISLDSHILNNMANETGVLLSVGKVDASTVTGAEEAACVIQITLANSEGNDIDFGGGNATVSVPYTLSIDGLSDMQVYCVEDGKEVETKYVPGTLEFVTEHFSNYAGYGVQELVLTETSYNLSKDETATITVDEDASSLATNELDYKSSNESVATVKDGVITAVGDGIATITVTAHGGDGYSAAEATVTVNVTESTTTPAAFSIELSSESGSVRRGRTFDVAEQISNKDALEEAGVTLTYTSADTSKVTVNATTGIANGVAVTTEPIDITIKGTGTDGATTSAVFALTVTRSSNGEDSSSSSSGGGGGGSSSSGYSVNVSSASNGTVSVDKDRASSGSTVTITAEPDEGYVVGSVTVTDSDGNEITVRDRGNNEYTFTMPSSRVTIEVEFVEDTTVEEPVDEITEADFSDVSSSDWFYDAVNYVFSKGIMVGVTENSFAPNSSLTRAMIVQMLYSLEGSPEVTGTAPFTDVAIGQWYTNAITWAASNNIVSGMGDGTFAPNNNITREQLAMILYNYAQLKGNAVTASGNLAAFTDGNEVSDWAETAVRWAVGEGLMSGKGNGVLDPTETTTRAEAASMFMRFMESDLA